MLTGFRATTGRLARVLALLAGGLTLVGLGLAGYGAVRASSGAGQLDYQLGLVIALISLLVAGFALASGAASRTVVPAVTMFLVAGLLQPSLAELGRDGGAGYQVLHALAGIAVLALAGTLARPVPATRDAVAKQPATTPTG
jgi:hypothetical protein